MSGICIDITERKQAQELLQEKEATSPKELKKNVADCLPS
jgi:hypothetical protein